jgi:DedD protein
MARTDGGGYSPKHRIVGAIIVIGLAVVLLPMILRDKQPADVPKADPTDLYATQGDTKVFKVPAASLKDVGAATESGQVAPPPEPTSLAVEQAHPKSASRQAAPTPSAKTQSQTVTSAQPPQANKNVTNATDQGGNKQEGWVVQVGTFTSNENAERLRQKLKKSGYLVNLEDIELKGSKAVRVRVGPFRQKHIAAEAQTRIHTETGLQGVIVAYP